MGKYSTDPIKSMFSLPSAHSDNQISQPSDPQSEYMSKIQKSEGEIQKELQERIADLKQKITLSMSLQSNSLKIHSFLRRDDI